MRRYFYYYGGALTGVAVSAALALWWYARVEQLDIGELLNRLGQAPKFDGG